MCLNMKLRHVDKEINAHMYMFINHTTMMETLYQAL